MVPSDQKPVGNPLIVLREEFDGWAVLFDPDTGEAFGLNPVSVFIWKHLDGNNTVEDILQKLGKECKNMPDDAADYVKKFIDQLLEKGLVGFEAQYNDRYLSTKSKQQQRVSPQPR